MKWRRSLLSSIHQVYQVRVLLVLEMPYSISKVFWSHTIALCDLLRQKFALKVIFDSHGYHFQKAQLGWAIPLNKYFVIHYIQPLISVPLSVRQEHHSLAMTEHSRDLSSVCVCVFEGSLWSSALRDKTRAQLLPSLHWERKTGLIPWISNSPQFL